MDMAALRARVEQAAREIHATREASPNPAMEGRPAVRAALAERLRLLSARHAAIGSAHASVLKLTARVERWRSERARTVQAIADCERRAKASKTEVESRAWLDGPPYLRGEPGFYERPGAVIAIARDLGIDRLPTLPVCDEMLAQAESDLAPYIRCLLSELDAWEQREALAEVW